MGLANYFGKCVPKTAVSVPTSMPTPQEEEFCMAAIAAGDARAYRAVMDAYMTDIFRFSYSLVANTDLAEEITQETFVRLWTKGRSWRPTGRIKSWLLAIAHNLCMNELGRRTGHIDIDAVLPALADRNHGPREALATKQVSDLIQTTLFSLPARQRAAVVLVHLQERTNIEAAEVMGISVEALESLLSRGRRALKVMLITHKDVLLGDVNG